MLSPRACPSGGDYGDRACRRWRCSQVKSCCDDSGRVVDAQGEQIEVADVSLLARGKGSVIRAVDGSGGCSATVLFCKVNSCSQ